MATTHRFLAVALIGTAMSICGVPSSADPLRAIEQSNALKIVVIAGEDAVNIIQQKTAVAPIVEVRDRNDQPVAGAVVNFAIRSGRASFGGARTLSVTTDVVGRAVASGLTPTGTGALQITASAAFQGQTATAVTIAQTNVMTAAQAAAIGGAQGAGGAGGANGGTGAAAGGGGGMSGTTIGVLVGAAAAGAVAATQAGGDDNGGSSGTPPPTPPTVVSPTPPAVVSPTVYSITFTPSLSTIAQCPQYTGPTGPGIGPFGMNITLRSDGSFSDLVSILTPIAMLTGVATTNSVTGTFSCNGGGGPTGGVNATGNAPDFQGTWNWGGLSGSVVIGRANTTPAAIVRP